MLVLGVLLILAAAGALVAALMGASTETSTFELGAFTLRMTTIGVFLAGAATVLLLMVGVALVSSGTRRANRRRKEKKELNRLSKRLEAQGDDRGTRAEAAGTASSGAPGASRTNSGGSDTAPREDPGPRPTA